MAESKDRMALHHNHHHHHHQQEMNSMQEMPQHPVTNNTHQIPVLVPQQMMETSVARNFAGDYSKITSFCLGILGIVFCILSIGCAIVALIYEASRAEEGSGFWCGAAYGVAGSVALAAGIRPSNNKIMAATVLSAIAVAFGTTQVTLSICSLVDMVYCNRNMCSLSRVSAAVISSAAMGTFGFWEVVFGVCLLIVGIRTICCPPRAEILMLPSEPPVRLPQTSVMQIQTMGQIASTSGYEQTQQERATTVPRCEESHPYSNFKK